MTKLKLMASRDIPTIERAEIEKKISGIEKTLRIEKEAYPDQVLKIYHNYEEMVFNLSEQTNNETMESIKAMSLGDRLKLQQLITKRNQAKNARKEVRS